MFSQKMFRLRASVSRMPRALAMVWRAARRWTLAWFVLLTLQGGLPIATVYLTREVVNRVVALTSAPTPENLQLTFGVVALFGVLILTAQILGSLSNWVRSAQSQLVGDYILNLIHTQAAALDLSFYDTPAYYDTLHRARSDAISRPIALLENLGSLWQNSITLVAMAGVLVPFGVWVPLALIVSTLPALGVTFYFTRRQHAWRIKTTGEQRRTGYYDWMLTLREAAPEMRLFGLGEYARTAYQTLRKKLREEQLGILRSQAVADLLAGAFGLAVMASVMGWMILNALQARLSLGDLTLLYQAFTQGQNLMRALLGNTSQMYGNLLSLEHLFEFLDLAPQVHEPAHPVPAPLTLREGIRFENVSFRYPDSARWALENLNLFIPAGQIAAIVGTNGAGKSTLIKLLCRFYDPTSGSILLDGVNVRDVASVELFERVTVLFQEPMHYHETAQRNIAFGDWHSNPDAARIRAASEAGGADEIIARLPDRYEQVLGKWFGGAELSVGEWQRVALARAFLRRGPVLILDEPTSAMDSWAEADWMARFRTLVAGRTALLITHRFTTAMQADMIHVMDCGRIVESGTHAQLLASGGRYAESWRRQMHEDG
jgi:ATP-binding cassette subfamily B protein